MYPSHTKRAYMYVLYGSRARGGEGLTWDCTVKPVVGDTAHHMKPQVSALSHLEPCPYSCWKLFPVRVMGSNGHVQVVCKDLQRELCSSV